MAEQPIAIYTASNRERALQLQLALREHGVASSLSPILQPDTAAAGQGSATQVLVAAKDAETAGKMAAEWARLAAPAVAEALEAAAARQDWRHWPQCPRCRQRRQAVCPVCQAAGDAFPLAEFPAPLAAEEAAPPDQACGDESEPAEEILLMCRDCDEAFTPGFYRLCHQCGFDFGEGLQLSEPSAADFNPRALAVLAGVVVLSALLLAFFFLVLP